MTDMEKVGSRAHQQVTAWMKQDEKRRDEEHRAHEGRPVKMEPVKPKPDGK